MQLIEDHLSEKVEKFSLTRFIRRCGEFERETSKGKSKFFIV